jgi:hypothetical protein
LQVVESCGEKRFSEIPLIAFLIFEESYFPLKRGMGERLIFEEPNLFKVERFSRAAGVPRCAGQNLDVESWKRLGRISPSPCGDSAWKASLLLSPSIKDLRVPVEARFSKLK